MENTESQNEIVSPEVDAITPDIDISIDGAGKTLIHCEKGIKSFVVDKLAKVKNHLPNTETGVWIYYLTQGIERDFGRTWERTPVALRSRETAAEKAYEKGKRIMSKKEKNELLDKMNFSYYQQDIMDKKITIEEAQAKMLEALNKKMELEAAGYFISPNKTQGVKPFDSQKEVETAATGIPNIWKLFTKNNIEVIVPNLQDNYRKNAKYDRECAKNDFTKTENDWKKQIELKEKEGYTIKGVHLVKINRSGLMKDRHLCLVLQDKKGKVELLLKCGAAEVTIEE